MLRAAITPTPHAVQSMMRRTSDETHQAPSVLARAIGTASAVAALDRPAGGPLRSRGASHRRARFVPQSAPLPVAEALVREASNGGARSSSPVSSRPVPAVWGGAVEIFGTGILDG